MKKELRLEDGYWIVFFCFQNNWIQNFGKIVDQCPLTEGTDSNERLAIAEKNNVNSVWDFYGMIKIENSKIRPWLTMEDGTDFFVGMNKESTAFYHFETKTFNIISYSKI